jgi:hypothetical protein
MKKRVLAAASLAALTLAGTAAGYAAARRVFTIHPGNAAVFSGKSGGWMCNNNDRFVECFTGDARPYARLTGSNSGGVTVKVYTLRGAEGRLTRTYERGQPVYIFRANP